MGSFKPDTKHTRHTTTTITKMFDLVPMGVFNGTLFQPRWQYNQTPSLLFQNFNLDNQDKPGRKTFALPTNLNPENLKISLDRATKTLSISAEHEEKHTDDSDEVISSSTQKFSYKFRFPESVKLESVKSHFETASGELAVNWEVKECEREAIGEPVQIRITE